MKKEQRTKQRIVTLRAIQGFVAIYPRDSHQVTVWLHRSSTVAILKPLGAMTGRQSVYSGFYSEWVIQGFME